MNLKYLAVITDIANVNIGNTDEIVGFVAWKDARDFLEQAARDHGDLTGDAAVWEYDPLESGLSRSRRYIYAIWEYDPDNEGGDRFCRTKIF